MFSKQTFKHKWSEWVEDMTSAVTLQKLSAKQRMKTFIERDLSDVQRDRLISSMNGIMGDTLLDKDSPYCRTMVFRDQHQTLKLEREALAKQLNAPQSRLLICIHGWCMSDVLWTREGFDHGQSFVPYGYSPVYLRYNSGLHISTNGERFAELLQTLVDAWPCPIKEIVFVGHSMGGLVMRSSLYYADQKQCAWLNQLTTCVTLGTPHNGAPLAQLGCWLDDRIFRHAHLKWLSAFTEVRSAGTKDLSKGLIAHSDWQTNNGAMDNPLVRPSLPKHVECYAIASCLGQNAMDMNNLKLGDGLVPVLSALGQQEEGYSALSYRSDHCWVGYGINHLSLLSHPRVSNQLKTWILSNTR